MPRAAHEKIAADLGHLLELPIPPVTLWTDPASGKLYSISAFAFPQALTWDQATPLRTPAFMANALSILAAGFVFHTWISDGDHGGNGGNVLIDQGSSEAEPSLAFIDHAFSMSQNWNEASPPCIPLGAYYAPVNDLPREHLERVVKRVQGIKDDQIQHLIGRVPPQFLPDLQANLIRKCLLRRRGELAAAFGFAD